MSSRLREAAVMKEIISFLHMLNAIKKSTTRPFTNIGSGGLGSDSTRKTWGANTASYAEQLLPLHSANAAEQTMCRLVPWVPHSGCPASEG